MKIGFIGLGIMGESMCENIVKKHDDKVYVLFKKFYSYRCKTHTEVRRFYII